MHGGPKLCSEPWPARGLIGTEEKAAVDALFEQAIASGNAPGYNGPEETAYCKEFAEFMGGGYVDAVNSGTAAIYVALKALPIPAFSEVIVGAITDPGGMMPIPLLNAIPVVADTAPGSFNTGPEQIEPLISPLTGAIIVPHIFGEPADIEGIMELAGAHGIPVIEDCAQAHGATHNGKKLGAFGDIAAFSTMFGKHHCTGGQGGLVFTRREDLYQRLQRASDRGKPFGQPVGSTNCTASLNLNLSDLAAAIGRVQLRKLPGIIAKRRAAVKALNERITGLKLVSPCPILGNGESSYWYQRLRFNADNAACDKETYCHALDAEGLQVVPSCRIALAHGHDWFVKRSVFGTDGYPWTSPEYKGDANRLFTCPHANAALDECFQTMPNEKWTAWEIEDGAAIFAKVDTALAA